MKLFKKMMALVIAMVMVVAMSIPAMAADTGSITINKGESKISMQCDHVSVSTAGRSLTIELSCLQIDSKCILVFCGLTVRTDFQSELIPNNLRSDSPLSGKADGIFFVELIHQSSSPFQFGCFAFQSWNFSKSVM